MDRSAFLARLLEATNAHDVERIVGCFTPRVDRLLVVVHQGLLPACGLAPGSCTWWRTVERASFRACSVGLPVLAEPQRDDVQRLRLLLGVSSRSETTTRRTSATSAPCRCASEPLAPPGQRRHRPTGGSCDEPNFPMLMSHVRSRS